MSELKPNQIYVERKTYLKGRFKGQFIGKLDHKKSDIAHEKYYDLEVISGKVSTQKDEEHIRHWQKGEPEEFLSVAHFLSALPEMLELEIASPTETTSQHFQIRLHGAKLSNFHLYNQTYENNNVFGEIEGEISGYLKHYDIEDIPAENQVKERTTAIGGWNDLPTYTYDEQEILQGKIETDQKTGNSQRARTYIRWEYYYSDGSTYWGDWERYDGPVHNDGGGIIVGIVILIYLFVILASLGKEVLPILGIFVLFGLFIWGLEWFLSRFRGWVILILAITLVILIILEFVSAFTNNN